MERGSDKHAPRVDEELAHQVEPLERGAPVEPRVEEFREQEVLVWQAFGTWVPSTGLYLDETPQVVVYRRPAP